MGLYEKPPYYLTAYGLAVKHGYKGTEEQFVEDIYGGAARADADAEIARQKASDSEAYGAGTRDGEAVPSDDPAYHNNAKYFKEQAASSASAAAESATAAEGSAEDSEAYAIGKRGGTDVESDDPAYHNNSKYYAGVAQDYAEHIGDPVAGIVTDWLEDNVDPETGYVLDSSLSSSLAAAPADKVGDLKSAFAEFKDGFNEIIITGWESGTIDASGNDGIDASRVRTDGYYEVDPFSRYYVDTNGMSNTLLIRGYNSSHVFKRSYNRDKNTTAWVTFGNDISYIRIACLAADKSSFTIVEEYNDVLLDDAAAIYATITCNKNTGAPTPTENYPDFCISKDLLGWTRVKGVLPTASFGAGAEPFACKIGDWYIFIVSAPDNDPTWDCGVLATKNFIKWNTYKLYVGVDAWRTAEGITDEEVWRRWAPSIIKISDSDFYFLVSAEYDTPTTSVYGDVCRKFKSIYKKLSIDDVGVLSPVGSWYELALNSSLISVIDCYVKAHDGTLYCIYKDEYNKIVNVASASSISGTFTDITTNVFTPYCESPCLIFAGENVHIFAVHYTSKARTGVIHTVTTIAFSNFTPWELIKFEGGRSTYIYTPRSIFPVKIDRLSKTLLTEKIDVLATGNSDGYVVSNKRFESVTIGNSFTPEPNIVYLCNQSRAVSVKNGFKLLSFSVFNDGDEDITIKFGNVDVIIPSNTGKTIAYENANNVYTI